MKGYYKSLKYLVYISQIGISMATPIVLMTIFGSFINSKFNFGSWFTIICIVIGAVSGFLNLIQTLNIIGKQTDSISKDEDRYE